ncbi:DUF6531 domain-containing protein [Criblamydia sequanensis]|uniref:Rhs family protein n=1 Tax=Candidatus Criblamydia sequanensis CRIB-18 TaxID=1437425 RepID=A0A090D2X2_9BACT|nr:DUF6531 domain-containing protein [Criblamydia sequanensis]CDR34713.1 Rhs family protein [Criblamydia sequanensis CRIB-18]
MRVPFLFLNFLFFICSFTNVFSITEKEYTHEKSLIDSQGLPTSVVDGCVNVISGDFVDFETDLALPSSELFTLSRSYTSSDYFMQSLCNGWSFNHGSFAEIDKVNKYTGIQIRNSSSILNYDSKERNTPTNLDRVRIDKSQWKRGMTNCAQGLPSAKSNLNNDVCDLEFNDKKLTYRRANGDKYFYTGPDKKLYLWGIDKANTLKYLYLYDKRFLLNSIVLRNKFNQPLCSLSINVEKSKTEIKTPSGKTVTWHFKSIKNAGNHCPFLCKVERDNGPDISYEHERYLAPWGKHVVRIKEKSLPENRFVKIKYYEVGENVSSDRSVSASIPDLNDSRYSRVIETQKPLGPMGEPLTAFSFLYKGYPNTDIKEKGFTEVFDALKRKRLYRYNKSRLEKIEYFQGENQRHCAKLYRTEHILWAGAGTFYSEGHLIGSGVSDASGKLKYLNQYLYDNVGNITRATLFGNLSGSDFDNVIIGSNNIPVDLGCEAYSETFKYSIDGLNNLIEEDNGKRLYQYQYLPETTLCTKKLMIADNEIKSRAFYEYDHNAVLIKEICDDGIGYDREDQTRVTRKITKTIVPTWSYPHGLPLEVYTTAFDYANNQEIMLSKVHNIYEGDGLLVRKDIYDQTNTLAISQRFTYDKKGNLIKEEGPLGSFVEREFDGNGNIIKERGALDGYYKRNEYDFCNRLIKEEEFFDGDLSLAKSYHYDLAGQMISETDLFGNKINYTYDDLGRVIKQELPEIQDGNGGSFRPTSTYEYDVLDCVTKTVDPLGGETIASYTSRKAPYYKKYPDGTTETVVYHHNGSVKESIDRLGNKTVIESDYQERPLKVSLYNSKEELLKETSKTYSAFDVISETDEMGIETTFDYDFAGRLSCKRKLNFKECYEYDTLSRLYKTITYTSDSDAVVSIKEYDSLNRVIEERVEDLNGNLNHRASFIYDQANRKTHTITYGENGPEVNETVYNKRGDIVAIIDPEGKVTRTDYEYGFRNTLGQLVLKTTTIDPMGLKTIIEKDALGHDFIIEKMSPIGKLLHKSTFYYNGNGQRVKVIEENNLKKVVLEKEFDISGNIIKVVEASNSEEAKVTRVEYNSLGQKSVVIKPSGITLNYNYECFRPA